DTTTAPSLEKTIKEDIGDTKNLVIDLKGLEYISSAGLRVLLSAQKKMQQIGGLKILNVGESIMEVFKITGFDEILTIE
ncbi:MAG: STAS domain-containing protein, partial [Clostridia bacterium]|nr:STAS domain-containing protein [Clostridia bacterium]